MTASVYTSVKNTTPAASMYLTDWLLDSTFKEQQEMIRAEINPDRQKQLKAELLPCITPSGLFSERRESGLLQHSGFIPFDIDSLLNVEVEPLKKIISEMPYTFSVSHSVRGNGLWGLFRIANKAKHKEHFAAMSMYFLKKLKIKIDPAPSNVASARFYSYDPNPFIKERSEVFPYLYAPEPKKSAYEPKKHQQGNSVADNFNLNGWPLLESILIARGWSFAGQRGTNLRYTRPGKTNGISANYCIERKIFYCFSSATETEMDAEKKAINLFQLYSKLETGGNWKEAIKKLVKIGF